MDQAVAETETGRDVRPASVPVWDPLVRIFHWSLVAAFTVAFVSADEWDGAHETAGYAVAGLVALRLLWGFVGTKHARFADFVYRPVAVVGFLKDTVRLRARRYLGHNPAGGAMVIALLAMLALVTGTGILMTTDSLWGVRWLEDVHEAVANLTLGLVALHVLGVLVASLEHGENLVKAMFTGRKRA